MCRIDIASHRAVNNDLNLILLQLTADFALLLKLLPEYLKILFERSFFGSHGERACITTLFYSLPCGKLYILFLDY